MVNKVSGNGFFSKYVFSVDLRNLHSGVDLTDLPNRVISYHPHFNAEIGDHRPGDEMNIVPFAAPPTMEDVRKIFTLEERLILTIAAAESDVRATREFASSINLAIHNSEYLARIAYKLHVNKAEVAMKLNGLMPSTKKLLMKALRGIALMSVGDHFRRGGFRDAMRIHGMLEIPDPVAIGLAVVRLENWSSWEFPLDRASEQAARSDDTPFDIDSAVAAVFGIARTVLLGKATLSIVAHGRSLLNRISVLKKMPLLRIEELKGGYKIVALDPEQLRDYFAEDPGRRLFVNGVNAPSACYKI